MTFPLSIILNTKAFSKSETKNQRTEYAQVIPAWPQPTPDMLAPPPSLQLAGQYTEMKRAMRIEPKTGARSTGDGGGGLPHFSFVKKNKERLRVDKMLSWMVKARPR